MAGSNKPGMEGKRMKGGIHQREEEEKCDQKRIK